MFYLGLRGKGRREVKRGGCEMLHSMVVVVEVWERYACAACCVPAGLIIESPSRPNKRLVRSVSHTGATTVDRCSAVVMVVVALQLQPLMLLSR